MRNGIPSAVALVFALAVMPLAARSAEEKVLPPNILRNSSFTLCHTPGIPDWWSNARGSIVLSDWPDCWRPDAEAAVPGTKSMRLSNPKDREGNSIQCYGFGASVGKAYTASVYLKSDQPQVDVSLSCSYLGSKKVKATSQWERFTITGVPQVGKDGRAPRFFFTIGFAKQGVLWVNAPQIEEGAAATDWRASPFDAADALLIWDKAPPKPAKAKPGQAPSPREAAPIPEAACPRFGQPPVLDGNLDDACWQTASRLTPFILYDSPKPATQQTVGMVARDAKNLYIALECREPDMAHLKATTTARDGSVFGDDEIEVFLSPYKDGHDYFQFGVNVAGAMFDGRGTDASWNGDWAAKMARAKDCWTVEMSIGLHNLGLNPKCDDTWRLNLCRHRPNPAGEEYSSWSRTFLKFHDPARFGRLTGVGVAELAQYFVSVGNLRLAQKTGTPTLAASFEVTSLKGGPGKAVAVATLMRAGAAPESREQEITLPSEKTLPVETPGFTAPEAGAKCDLRVSLLDPSSRDILAGATVVGAQTLIPVCKPPITALANRSFYTDESEALLRVSTHLEPADRQVLGLNVTITPQQGGAATKKFFPPPLPPEFPVAIRLNARPEGVYQVKLDLCVAEGPPKAEWSGTIEKLSKRPNEVKIDRWTQSLIVNDKPFIPYAMGVSYNTIKDHEQWAYHDIASRSFNSIIHTFSLGTDKDEDVKRRLDLMHAEGLKVFPWVTFPAEMKYEDIKKGVVRWVEMFRDHPAVVAWKIIDEPELWWSKKEDGRKPEDLVDYSNAVHKADPYHPNFRNHCGRWVRGSGVYAGLEGTDLYSFDRYPIGRTTRAMESMAELVDDMMFDGKRDGKPVAEWLMIYGSYDSPREPTPEEHRCQTYIVMIHGSRVIFYFIYRPMSVPLLDSMIPLGKEIARLTPVFLAPEVAEGVQANDPAIHATLRVYDGVRYLITVNATAAPVRARLKIAGGEWALFGKKAEVLFEGRTVSWDGKTLSDSYAPFDRHVYRLD